MTVRSFLTIVLASSSLLLSPADGARAAEVIGGFAITGTQDAYDASYTSGNDTVSAQAGSPGFEMSARSQTSAWQNKIEILSDLSMPPGGAGTYAYAAAQSFYAVNQVLTGPGSTAQASYQFSVGGSFVPGPEEYFPDTVTPQNLAIFLVAYYGKSLSTELRPDGVFVVKTTNGQTTLNLLPDHPAYIDENLPFIIPGSFASACAGLSCRSPIDFNNYLMNINVDIETGRDFSVIAYVSSFTNGRTDFFNTVKLNSITIDPAYTLTADDGGALVRGAGGEYTLAAAVPEPATWATMLLGLSVIGGAMRYRRRPKDVVGYACPREV
ncbi:MULTISPECIES: PEPxxWA-CTERM sorting domain-containing protein [unclassified Sphingopyxis]|uniref:PEPxxWA-CTERM sorting domain-containing protein n=1 Tax=Sphingopyxis sp. H073 TaxID=1759079 RepID=UPI0009E6EE8C|nr:MULTISPECIES: PEPxxWA-CTERM sorting domain-containing protein [unclassified Sphingopyxis]